MMKKYCVPKICTSAESVVSTIKLEECPIPTPVDNQVVCEVHASSLVKGDILLLYGGIPGNPKTALVPGWDFVGVVVAIGPKVNKFGIGDKVGGLQNFAGGGCATHVCTVDVNLFKLPSDCPSMESAVTCVLTGMTAMQMVDRATDGRVNKPDCKVLIHGCSSGVGTWLVEICKLRGIPPSNIFGTCSDRGLATATATGIHVINYKTEDFVKKIKSATSGQGVDVVFDPFLVGGYYGRDFQVLKWGGKIVAYSLGDPENRFKLNIPDIILFFARNALQNNFFSLFDQRKLAFYSELIETDKDPNVTHEDAVKCMELLHSGKVKPTLPKVYSFEQVPEVFQLLLAGGPQTVIKMK